MFIGDTLVLQNPSLLLLLLVIPLLVVMWFWRGRRITPTALVFRLITIALIVLAVANPMFGQAGAPQQQMPLVILVDQSDSLTAAGQAELRSQAMRLANTFNQQHETLSTAQNQHQRATIFWFGDEVVAAGDGSTEATSEQDTQLLLDTLNPASSNLVSALHTAQEFLVSATNNNESDNSDTQTPPNGSTASISDTGRIVLLSDGIQTAGDALTEAHQAAAAGITIDVLPFETTQHTDVRIGNMQAPRLVRMGEEYPIQIVLHHAPADGTPMSDVTLKLWADEELLAEETVSLDPGDNFFTFRHQAINAGITRLRAEITAPNDTFVQNNRAATTTTVAPAQRILVVEGRPGNSSELTATLWNTGIESQVIAPSDLPESLSELESYDGMVLLDVPTDALSLAKMTSVREFVQSVGRGLVVAGGQNSFGLGGYKGTPLEEVLPVSMDPPPRDERSDVSLLLIIDRSASMTIAIGVSKFDMAKEAAILATETLESDDRIGVLAFDTRQTWNVPFQTIGTGLELKDIQDTIARLASGGGTDIFGALFVGLSELTQQPTDVRHVVLLTDGRSFTNDLNAYQQLTRRATDQGITISTIAIGRDADIALLNQLADWGGGRSYYADEPEDIPRLTLRESEIARIDPAIEGDFQAELAMPHPLMRDFAPSDIPALSGYVATTPKDQAEMVLRSPDDEPVLVGWQYGLGRAVAWTSSVAAPWAAPWPSWSEYGRFWSQVVRYTLPDPEGATSRSPLHVQFEPQPGGARLVVDATNQTGTALNLATIQARMTLPDGTQHDIALRQTAPGRYTQDLLLPNDGPYAAEVVLAEQAGGQQYSTQVGYVQAVPSEYYPPQETAQGTNLLQNIAQITNGQVLTAESDIESTATETNDTAVEDIPVQMDSQTMLATQPIWLWLLAAALLTWLLEIGVRRGLFTAKSYR